MAQICNVEVPWEVTVQALCRNPRRRVCFLPGMRVGLAPYCEFLVHWYTMARFTAPNLFISGEEVTC